MPSFAFKARKLYLTFTISFHNQIWANEATECLPKDCSRKFCFHKKRSSQKRGEKCRKQKPERICDSDEKNYYYSICWHKNPLHHFCSCFHCQRKKWKFIVKTKTTLLPLLAVTRPLLLQLKFPSAQKLLIIIAMQKNSSKLMQIFQHRIQKDKFN